MYTVFVYFSNGESTRFQADEFDIDLEAETSNPNRPHRFTYKAPGDVELPIFLAPNEVAGIVVVPVATG
jgi:hypothetical protein